MVPRVWIEFLTQREDNKLLRLEIYPASAVEEAQLHSFILSKTEIYGSHLISVGAGLKGSFMVSFTDYVIVNLKIKLLNLYLSLK